MAKRYDVVAAAGEYTAQDGSTKVRWINCGAVFEKDGKLSMKMDSYAVGDGWYKLFVPKQRGATQASNARTPQHEPAPHPDDPSDPIPF